MRAKKRFGQHFLHDPAVVERIVAAIRPEPDGHLVEIGPGTGALTGPLLAAGAQLVVIEIDRELIGALREREHASGGRLRVIEADALAFDYSALRGPATGLRLLGNLPYNIATELIFRLLRHAPAIRDMHFMLQREVVERLAAPPGSRARGRLSVMVQAWCEVQALFTVRPGAFRPAPAVDSALVRLLPHAAPCIGACPQALFEQLVRAAFGQRRKTLRNALHGVAEPGLIERADIDPGTRAERLTVSAFARLGEVVDRDRRALVRGEAKRQNNGD